MNNWQTKKLGEVVQIQNGFTFKSSEYTDSGFFVMRITNVQNGFIELNNPKFIKGDGKSFGNFILNESDILMSLTGNVGRVGVIRKEHLPAVLNQRVARLYVRNENELDKNYLFSFLRSPKFFNEVVAGGRGMAQQNVSTKDIENLEIPLPPLEEQKEIVKVLDEKMGKIAEAKMLREGAIADTEKILSQTLHEIFEEGKKKGWGEKTIDDIAIQIKSGFACGKQNEVSTGIVHLRTHNVSLDGELNLDKIVRIPENFVDTSIFTLKKDDLIFNNTNSVELVGKTILIHEDLPYAFSNHLTRIRFDEEQVTPAWVLYVFQKYWADKVFERMCTRWIGQAGINQTSLSKIKILIPSLPEQQKIVKRLDELSEKIRKAVELQKSQLDDLKKLEKSYLREAFNGELI